MEKIEIKNAMHTEENNYICWVQYIEKGKLKTAVRYGCKLLKNGKMNISLFGSKYQIEFNKNI